MPEAKPALPDALARVTKYLDERAKMPRLEQEEIASLHIGDEREAILNVSDLRAIIAACVDSGWIEVENQTPEVDKDGMAYVWAVDVGSPHFPRAPQAGKARYHKVLGWQPEGSTGWDYVVTHWRHYPPLPTIAGAA